MNSQIILVSDRGQITIPQKIRARMKVKYFVCTVENEKIILSPMQTREDFFAELDEAEKDWEKQGGKALKQIKEDHKL